MATTTTIGRSRLSTAPALATWILPGLAAGLVFAMWTMMVGLFTSTLWAPPQGIAQALGIGSPGHQLQPLALVAGLMGHMMNSVVVGAIFLIVVRALRLRGRATLMAGMVFGLGVYAVMYWALLRGVLSANSASFLSSNPEWSWVMGHLMFGAVLAALLLRGPWRLRTAQDD